MTTARVSGLFLVLACASSAASSGATESPSVSSSSSSERVRATTRYRRGDYVVYRYRTPSGLTVLLEETIERVDGDRLWIHVVARRGAEQREWIQVVTDTVTNRESNTVDELVEIQGDTRTTLPNDDNRDLARLYAWTLPPCGAPHDPQPPTNRSVGLGDGECEARCVMSSTECGHAPARLETCDCESFVWTHASARLWIAGDDAPHWQVDVVEQGHDDPPIVGRLPRPEWL